MQQAIARADALYASITPKTTLSKAQQAEMKALSQVLDQFNRGVGGRGAPRCG